MTWTSDIPAERLAGDPHPDANTGVAELDALLARGTQLGLGPESVRRGRNSVNSGRFSASALGRSSLGWRYSSTSASVGTESEGGESTSWEARRR